MLSIIIEVKSVRVRVQSTFANCNVIRLLTECFVAAAIAVVVVSAAVASIDSSHEVCDCANEINTDFSSAFAYIASHRRCIPFAQRSYFKLLRLL